MITTEIAIVLLTALVNGAVTWGVVSTKLAWMRQDIERLERHIESLKR